MTWIILSLRVSSQFIPEPEVRGSEIMSWHEVIKWFISPVERISNKAVKYTWVLLLCILVICGVGVLIALYSVLLIRERVECCKNMNNLAFLYDFNKENNISVHEITRRCHKWSVIGALFFQAYFCNTVLISQWRHNERDGVSNNQPQDYLFYRLFKASLAFVSGIRRWRWIPRTKGQ